MVIQLITIYDAWNIKKKVINSREKGSYYREQEIWWCKLGLNIGFEQDGTGLEFDRPVLILRSFNKYICLIVPLTTSVKRNKYYRDAGILDGKPAAAVISQIRLIDTRRITERAGFLNKDRFKDIKKAVRSMI